MKIILITTALCLSCTLTAFEGFYIGGSLGGSITTSDQTGRSIGGYTPVFLDVDYVNDFSGFLLDHSFEGMLYAGYGFLRNRFFLGVEGFEQFNSISLVNHEESETGFGGAANFMINTNTTVDFKAAQLGIDFRPGVMLTPTSLIYGRIGVGATKVKLQVEDQNNGFALGDTWLLPVTLISESLRPTLRLGGGFEQRISSQFSIKADYIFSDYGTLSVLSRIAGISDQGNPIDLSTTVKERLRNHCLLFGLVYYFCSEPIPWGCLEEPAFGGIYSGMGLGAAFFQTRQDGIASGFQLANPVSSITDVSPYLYDIPFEGAAYLGYGIQKNYFYLGGEFFVQGSTTPTQKVADRIVYMDFDPNNNFFSVEQKNHVHVSPWQYGFDLRPGIILKSNTMLYGRVGAARAKMLFESEAILDGAIPLLPETWNLQLSLSERENRTVLRLGGGIEQRLFSNLYLRMDYCYTNYRKFNLNDTIFGQTSIGNDTVLTDTTSGKITSHSVLLNLSWHFHSL